MTILGERVMVGRTARLSLHIKKHRREGIKPTTDQRLLFAADQQQQSPPHYEKQKHPLFCAFWIDFPLEKQINANKYNNTAQNTSPNHPDHRSSIIDEDTTIDGDDDEWKWKKKGWRGTMGEVPPNFE
ncbi:hypothetical protein niasHS_013817 [Heterodera schachtii]|uniref:Uncharacterized protein n=1 Tax=Heterodera schachtii TaxID=97005 RepID=A0ABD2IS79_HETSC